MKKLQKFYIAYSIHGTNQFITASIETTSYGTMEVVSEDGSPKQMYTIFGNVFFTTQSRRFNYSLEKDGIKLHWGKLKTKEGEPLRSPGMIIKHFKELEQKGWVVDRKAFTDKYFGKKEQNLRHGYKN